ncbi:MAG TPA: hypothetical protein VIK10_07895 [Prolixibacteraceae bacterium]
MEKYGIPVKIELPNHLSNPDAAPCLMSRINHQEKWEQTLDGLMILIKETQTRYKLVLLSPEQQRAVKIIKQGVVIPFRGKEKLLKAVSHLSGIMTVHSDMAESSSSATTIEADARIRVQIIPIGDGLKAEMFVKPLNSAPPYMKPGKGGKVVYGMVDGQKFQAIRELSRETGHANTISAAKICALSERPYSQNRKPGGNF